MIHHAKRSLNPFPNNKILDQTKLKAFTDDKLSVTKMIVSVFDRVENIAGKREIACTSNFSFYHNVFKMLLSQTRQNVSLCGNGLKGIAKSIDPGQPAQSAQVDHGRNFLPLADFLCIK